MNKLFPIIGGVIAIGVLFLLTFLSGGQDHSRMNMNKAAGRQAPDFALPNYGGQIITRANFSGKPLVINSWAVWCPFCVKELADFATVQKELGNKVVIIAIDRAESREIAKKFTDELGITDDIVFLLDSTDSFYQSIGGFSMPETIFVDKNGKIVDHKRGPMDLNEIRERVRGILGS